MPELPEVETIRQSLAPLIKGKVVDRLQTYTEEVLENPHDLSPAGAGLLGLERKGKYLRLLFSDFELMVHLRMTGKLIYHEAKENVRENRHIRAELLFTDESRLQFEDIRRFGRLKLLRSPEEDKGYASLGPDALSDDFTFSAFAQRISRHGKSPVKAALLNQRVVAGLGNIYCDELLFRSRIRPDTPVERISSPRLKALFLGIRPMLEEAVGLGGTSFRDYVDGLGKKGQFQLSLAVYQREGMACPGCGAEIKKTVVAGRGTRFCPSCQKPVRKRS